MSDPHVEHPRHPPETTQMSTMSDPEAALAEALHEHHEREDRVADAVGDGLLHLCTTRCTSDILAGLTALGLTIAPIAEAEAGAALARLGEYARTWYVSNRGDTDYIEVETWLREGGHGIHTGPTLPAAVDAATIGREGEDR